MKKKDLAPREFRGPTKRTRKSLLIIYTGNGKGKSTAGFGTVFRSLGRGYKAAIVQFIKGKWISGEVKALERFGSQVEYHSVGEGFTWETKSLKRDIELAEEGWRICLKLLAENRHDVYLFDELLYVLMYKFLPLKKIAARLKKLPANAHVILTGRNAPPVLVKMADLVTEMKEVKHPFQQGILAQPGIDY